MTGARSLEGKNNTRQEYQEINTKETLKKQQKQQETLKKQQKQMRNNNNKNNNNNKSNKKETNEKLPHRHSYSPTGSSLKSSDTKKTSEMVSFLLLLLDYSKLLNRASGRIFKQPCFVHKFS